MNQANRIVKKYPNRRLYDTTESRYITLNDVRQLVIEGRSVKVIENKTGQDITSAILLQVISELQIPGGPLMSEAFLTGIIRAHSNGFSGLIRNYLELSLQLALDKNGAPNLPEPCTARYDRWLDLQKRIVAACRGETTAVPQNT